MWLQIWDSLAAGQGMQDFTQTAWIKFGYLLHSMVGDYS